MFKLDSTEPLICSDEVHIKDSKGEYVKSVCDVGLIYNYDQARAKCLEYGAQLFLATSQDEMNAVAEHADCVVGSGNLWIEGKKDNNCSILNGKPGSHFSKTRSTCTMGYYFYCEYTRTNIIKPVPSEFKLTQANQ
jgi:hypothetical protein